MVCREIVQAEIKYRNASQDPERANKLLDRVANLYHHATKEIERSYDNFILDRIENQAEDELLEVKTYFLVHSYLY